jgi:hypothetical protein
MNTTSKNRKLPNRGHLEITGVVMMALAIILASCTTAPPAPPATITPQPPTSATCQLVSQTPPDNSALVANTAYPFTWVIKNTGTTKWDQSEYDIIFVSSTSGSSMYEGSGVYDLPSTVNPGQTVTISGTGTTPSTTGSYTENWAVAQGKNPVCPFNVVIQVK